MMNSGKESSGQNGTENKNHMTNQLVYIKNVVFKALYKLPNSYPFREPVDTVKLQLPDYYEIVTKPMDMSTIKAKLESYQYASAQECIDDFKLMFSNCRLYNNPKDDVVFMCEETEALFNKKISAIPKEEVIVDKGAKKGKGKGPASKQPTSNGNLLINSSIHQLPPPKLETPKPKNDLNSSWLPTIAPTPKFTTPVNSNRVVPAASASAAATASSLATATITNANPVHSAVTFETNSSTKANSLPPSSKIKKGVKRKASSPLRTHETPLNSSYDPNVFGKPTLAEELPEGSGRPVKRTKKETPEEQSQHSYGVDSKKPLSESLAFCYDIMKGFFQKPLSNFASHFYKPVDSTLPDLQGYYAVVKKPMDFETIMRNFDNRVYRTSSEFAVDVRQVFTNCYRFFPPPSEIVLMARKLQDNFEVLFARKPDDLSELVEQKPPHINDAVNNQHESESESSSSEDDEDGNAKAREQKLKMLQEQLLAVQEELARLTEAQRQVRESKEKKTKKKTKERVPEVKMEVSVAHPELSVPLGPIPVAIPQFAETLAKPPKAVKTKAQTAKKPRQRAPSKVMKTVAANIPEAISVPLQPQPAPAHPVSAPLLPAPAPPPPVPAPAPIELRPMTYDEKRLLSEEINCLPPDKLRHLIDIISKQQSMNSNEEEIEIDFEALPLSTLRELEQFVKKCRQEALESSKNSFEKNLEMTKHSDDTIATPAASTAVAAAAENEAKKLKKAGTLDVSPSRPIGHSLPQQPMRPCAMAAPKPPTKTVSTPLASSLGSQMPPAVTESLLPTLTTLPQPPVIASRLPVTIQDEHQSPPSAVQQSPFSRHSGLAEPKVGHGGEPRPDDHPSDSRSSSLVSVAPSKTALGKPHSPAAFSAKKPASKNTNVGSGNEDSASPKPSTKPSLLGTTFTSPSTDPRSSLGPQFGIDPSHQSKTVSSKDSFSKPIVSEWSLSKLASNSQSSSQKSVTKQRADQNFEQFRRKKAEQLERARVSQEQDEMRRQREKMENVERQRLKREQQRAKEEAEALAKVLSSCEPKAQPPPSTEQQQVTPEQPQQQRQQQQQQASEQPTMAQKELERLREQQRRRLAASASQIDINAQSELMASFESHFN